ncbi:MAG: type I-B CRISPR-associated endonuclease Cas1b [Thermoplasmata archaeon]
MYSYYITQNGKIEREGSTLYFIGEDFKKHLPAQNISEIIISAKVSISSWALDYFSKVGIIVHVLSEDFQYLSSIIPYTRSELGQNVILQSEYYLDNTKRIKIAAEIVNGIKYNILRNLRYYNEKIDLNTEISKIKNYDPYKNEIEAVRGIEGNIWNVYYSTFPKIFKDLSHFERKYNPPPDPINAMISFGNTLLYSTTLTAIILSGLNPAISFLHEPSDRSFSLALDIADIFKPVIVERMISNLINNKIIKDSYFTEKNDGCYLNAIGKKIFMENYRDKIETVLKLRENNKYLSYQSIIQNECYKLMKSLRGEIDYKAYRAVD